ncbi:hypothetical protein D3C74_334150 [compost metagenome]
MRVIDEGHRKHQLVPTGEEGEDRYGSDRGTNQRQNDMKEGSVNAASVDHRGFLHLAGNPLEEAAENEYGHRNAERDVRNNQRPVGVQQMQIF